MATEITCEACGNTEFDLSKYRSMMLVGDKKALFTLACPQCGATVSALRIIPESLRGVIAQGAAEVDAGMGRNL